MYGYVRADKNNLSAEAARVYRAHFCGLCKAAGKRYGRFPRLFTNFDITFLDVFLRAVSGGAGDAAACRCRLCKDKNLSVIAADSVSEFICDVNIILSYYKLTDDVEDGGGIKPRLTRLFTRRHYKKARARLPEADALISGAYAAFRAFERSGSDNMDAAAHGFAALLRSVAEYGAARTGQAAANTDAAGRLFYNLGKWIYLLDAADDAEEDGRSGNFNALVNKGKSAGGAHAAAEIKFILYCSLNAVRAAYGELKAENAARFAGAGGEILDNIIYFGLPKKTERVLHGLKNF